MDTISPGEVARRLEKLDYTEEAERIEKIFSEAPLYRQSLQSMKALELAHPHFSICKKPNRLPKNVHLLRFPNPSSLRRTSKYASFLRISGALHLGIFEQPAKNDFFMLPAKVQKAWSGLLERLHQVSDVASNPMKGKTGGGRGP